MGHMDPKRHMCFEHKINSATGETLHYILFGEDKNLPYSLLETKPLQVYKYDDFIQLRSINSRKSTNASEIT